MPRKVRDKLRDLMAETETDFRQYRRLGEGCTGEERARRLSRHKSKLHVEGVKFSGAEVGARWKD